MSAVLSLTASDVDILDIAEGLAASAHDVVLDERDGTRRYTRVLATPQYDAWIIEWSASAGLDLHDHGGSSGVVLVVDGELLEVRVDDRNRVARTRRTVARRGDVIHISPQTIHAVSNIRPSTALSVHVYSPPLSSMTFYDDGERPERRH